jgi:protein SCO1/2
MVLVSRPLAIVLLAAGGLAHVQGLEAADESASSGQPLPFEQLFGGPFELVDHRGTVRTERDFRGKYLLMYFGYTHCPSICPGNLQQIAVALELLGDQGRNIVPVFVTLDPARDDRSVVGAYVEHFGPRFVGLTGSERQVRAIAKAYRVHRRKVVEAGSDRQDYLVDHASLTHLIGPDGNFLTLFAHNTAAAAMAATIRKYLPAS